MAIINCPECSKEISDTAKSCPHCGFRIKASGSGCAKYFLFGFLALFVFYLLGSNSPNLENNMALAVCEKYIETILKNPDSANFDESTAVVETKDDGITSVIITVRATNSFNAIIPSTFVCHAKNHNGNWQALNATELK